MEPSLEILRLTPVGDVTQGVLFLDGIPTFTTLELPWLNNQHNISSVPLGTYTCTRRAASPSITAGLGSCFQLLDVPDRNGILIHVANTVRDLKGCIGIGLSYDKFGKDVGIVDSRRAFIKFMALMTGINSFKLLLSQREYDGR